MDTDFYQLTTPGKENKKIQFIRKVSGEVYLQGTWKLSQGSQ